MKMKSSSSPTNPISIFFNWLSAICAGICLTIALISHFFPDAPVVKPIYDFLMKDIARTNYILCILILCCIGARAIAFIFSFFSKKETADENSKILEVLSGRQAASEEKTTAQLEAISERVSKVENRMGRVENSIKHNAHTIHLNLKHTGQKVFLFKVQGKRSLVQVLKNKIHGTADISKKEVLDTLKETEKLVEKYQDDK